MATRITTLKPPCAYNAGGITSVRVLDYDDFTGLSFDGAGQYESCLVTGLYKTGDFADVQAKAAKYSGGISGKIINHTLETFIESMAADFISAIHLASRRRYVVVFSDMDYRTFLFGYEAGAVASYTGQTDGAQGFLITFTAPSIYPLFEVTDDALLNTAPTVLWLPDFTNGAYCETI